MADNIASICGDRIIDSGDDGGGALSIPKGGWLERPEREKIHRGESTIKELCRTFNKG
jgi:hypothetical protein